VDDVKALLGPDGFVAAKLFAVEYYRDANFTGLAKKSVTPMIDFDLGTEPGTGSPDASAGVPRENFSIRWTGTIIPPAPGNYTFYLNGSGRAKLFVNGRLLLDLEAPAGGEISGQDPFAAGKLVEVKIEYVHATGDPSLHVTWSGPNFERQVLTPYRNASPP